VNVRYGTIDEYFQLIDTTATSTAASTATNTATSTDIDTATATTTDTVTDTASIWPSFDGDFFPLGTNNNIYSSDIKPTKDSDNQYWTGHYTTRPLMKGLVAQANGAKHTAEVAASLACARGSSPTLCATTPNSDVMIGTGPRFRAP
jgi:hypothetical protein